MLRLKDRRQPGFDVTLKGGLLSCHGGVWQALGITYNA